MLSFFKTTGWRHPLPPPLRACCVYVVNVVKLKPTKPNRYRNLANQIVRVSTLNHDAHEPNGTQPNILTKPKPNHPNQIIQNTRTYKVLLSLGLEDGQHRLFEGAAELGLETVEERRLVLFFFPQWGPVGEVREGIQTSDSDEIAFRFVRAHHFFYLWPIYI